MFLKDNFVVAAAAMMVGAVGATALADPIPIEDFARMPQIQQPSLSMDGKHLVALVAPSPDAEKAAIAVYDLENPDQGPVIANPDGDSEFVFVTALKAGKVLTFARNKFNGDTLRCDGEFTTGIASTYTRKLFLADMDLKKFEDPFKITGTQRGIGAYTKRCLEIAILGNIRGDLLPLDPENVVVLELDRNSFRTEYKIVNLKTGKSKLLFKDNAQESAGYIDPRDAKVWTKGHLDSDAGEYNFETLIRDAEGGGFDVHDALTTDTKDRHSVSVVGRDEATGKFYVITDQFSGLARVYMYDAQAHAYDRDPAFAHQEFSAQGVVLGRTENDFNQLLGFRYFADIPRVYWVDPYFSQVQTALEGSFPGQDIQIMDYAMDKSKILFSVSSSNQPPRYFLFVDNQRLVAIGESAPWIDTDGLNKTELVYYTARDGKKIPGLLTPPANWTKGDPAPPSVVLPHGGPWARDFAGWDPTGWIQYFASRGYSVLQPQYRGSTGFTRDLWMSGDAQWGKTMQDDKDDGAAWLVDNGYADEDRMIIFGYSYGGYAAFAASVREGGPFKCAIAGAGVSDLVNIGNNWSENRLQRILQGRTVKGMSPLEEADNIQMPILIIHGDRDVRVPVFHSTKFYDKVKDKTKATYVEVEDMPHSLPWTPAQQRTSLNAVEEFLNGDCKL